MMGAGSLKFSPKENSTAIEEGTRELTILNLRVLASPLQYRFCGARKRRP